ncbi:hypothetical protein [Cellulomonas sp. SG140]|nr:hypothetical protein [Cellulomonas sp. SG140]
MNAIRRYQRWAALHQEPSLLQLVLFTTCLIVMVIAVMSNHI